LTEPCCLVTGASGFLGVQVVKALLGLGRSVVGLVQGGGPREAALREVVSHPLFVLERGDVRDADGVARLCARRKPAEVIHLAAFHFIPHTTAEPARALAVNVVGTQCLLSAALREGARRFWFASTADVYAPDNRPHAEEAVPGPVNIYGLSKLMGEQLVALAAKGHPEVAFVVGRLFNMYGAGNLTPQLIPELVRQVRERPGAPVRVGDLSAFRDLVPVADAARAVVETMRAAPPGVTTVNVATGVAHPVSLLPRLIGAILGRELETQLDPVRIHSQHRPHLQADVSRLRALIGWAPHADLRRGLKELLVAEGLAGEGGV
jgi:UDP-glucose 4-epimerase